MYVLWVDVTTPRPSRTGHAVIISGSSAACGANCQRQVTLYYFSSDKEEAASS